MLGPCSVERMTQAHHMVNPNLCISSGFPSIFRQHKDQSQKTFFFF